MFVVCLCTVPLIFPLVIYCDRNLKIKYDGEALHGVPMLPSDEKYVDNMNEIKLTPTHSLTDHKTSGATE